MAQDTGLSEQVAQLNRGQDTIWVLLTGSLVFFIENLGLKPRRSTTALPLNTSAFTKYMLKCETWKKPIRFDFTPHQNKSRYCGALWAV
jgi:putative transposase